ncbi:hypothetical protein Tco_1065778 [Tanacetum coccineum]
MMTRTLRKNRPRSTRKGPEKEPESTSAPQEKRQPRQQARQLQFSRLNKQSARLKLLLVKKLSNLQMSLCTSHIRSLKQLSKKNKRRNRSSQLPDLWPTFDLDDRNMQELTELEYFMNDEFRLYVQRRRFPQLRTKTLKTCCVFSSGKFDKSQREECLHLIDSLKMSYTRRDVIQMACGRL